MPPQQFFEVVGAQDAVALHAVVVRTAKAREETQAVDALEIWRWGSALINAETKKNNKTTCPNLHL